MTDTKSRWDPRLIAVSTLCLCALVSSAAKGDVNPGSLLIYYGWPSSINESFTIPRAAQVFGQYDIVVLGDGLQNGPGTSTPHPDYFNTLGIINNVAASGTDFYGYIDLGVTTQNLPLSEIHRRVDAWKAMGATGILFDDFGYDFATPRQRQNQAVNYAHLQGMSVIANGWRPEDVFSSAAHFYNPQGLDPVLGPGDFYLSESHQIKVGKFDFAAAWLSKARKVENFQDQYGFEVLSITTNDLRNAYDEDKFHYAWYSAALFGHAGTGWGEYVFSASGPGNAQAPFRERPDVDLGDAFLSDVRQMGTRYNRKTDEGVIFIDTATHAYGFLPTGDMDGNGSLDAFDIDDFERALADPIAYQQRYPKLDPMLLGDVNLDGVFNAGDIVAFETMMSQQIATALLAIPEPASGVCLVMLGLAGSRRVRRIDRH